MQLIPLAKAANQFGLKTQMLSMDIDKPSILNQLGSPDICFISKINHYDDDRVEGFAIAVLAAVARLKAIGTKIVLLYCDNLASQNCSRGRLYRDLLRLTEHCVVPSQSMAELAQPYVSSRTPISVIEDPWQVREQPYSNFNPSEQLRITWFGNTSNIFYVAAQIRTLMITVDQVDSIELVILSSKKALEIVNKAFSEGLPFARSNWSLRLVEWDHENQPKQLEDVLGSSHFVWIPSNPHDALKAGVSHNRLIDSVRSGCIPVASEMPSYIEMSKLALIGPDHGNLINLAVPQYNRLIRKYKDSRAIETERFSPIRNHRRWLDLLSSLTQKC